jgi:LysM repeat protein
MRKIIIILAVFCFCFVHAQTSIEHVVQEKETLYGISKQYNVSVDVIQAANAKILENGLKIGQNIIIPDKKTVASIAIENPVYVDANISKHTVLAKESLFSIARLYNVSVQDLDFNNFEVIKNGLQIGQVIVIPNKKKTLSGQARIINSETIFHVVLPKETKYSITKEYGISIEQLESQNPEIVNGLVEGTKLAINKNAIKPKNDNEELMVALAEKQVEVEKNKAKDIEIQNVNDKLNVQKQMNQKVIQVNNLKINLNAIDAVKGNSTEKLKLVLDANRNIQDILISKLDSLVTTINDELITLKNSEITDLENSKKLEKEAYENSLKTNDLLFQLKRDLADNRKTYSLIMNKVQRIKLEENQIYKKKVKENKKVKSSNPTIGANLIDDIYKMQTEQSKIDAKNNNLVSKIDSLGLVKNREIKRRIGKATFYSEEAREYDDRMALLKLKHQEKKVINEMAKTNNLPEKITNETINKSLKDNDFNKDKNINIKVLKNLKTVKNGYYLVLETFNDSESRDKFANKLIASGQTETRFFYDFNIFSYHVYTKFSENLDELLYQLKLNEKKPNFEKAIIIEIKNEN